MVMGTTLALVVVYDFCFLQWSGKEWDWFDIPPGVVLGFSIQNGMDWVWDWDRFSVWVWFLASVFCNGREWNGMELGPENDFFPRNHGFPMVSNVFPYGLCPIQNTYGMFQWSALILHRVHRPPLYWTLRCSRILQLLSRQELLGC